MSGDKVKETLKQTTEYINNALKVGLKDELNNLIPLVEKNITSHVLDSCISEIGVKLNQPKEIIDALSDLNQKVKGTEGEITGIIEKLWDTVKGIKEQIGDQDLNRTVTMSYWQLIKEKAKSALYWFISGFSIGILAGIVLYSKLWS